MKIVFIASIKGKEKYKDIYERIIKTLKKTGNDVLADHVMDYEYTNFSKWDDDKKNKYYKDIINRIKNADIVVSEISFPSISVGFLLSLAVTDFYKPTIVLFSGQTEPSLLTTLEAQNKVQLLVYDNPDEIDRELVTEINFAKDQMDVRFNFFVPPKIVHYLDWISKKRKIPRAVYLRRLIEEDIEKNKDFLTED